MADKGCGEVVEGVWLASVEENDDKTVLRKIDLWKRVDEME